MYGLFSASFKVTYQKIVDVSVAKDVDLNYYKIKNC